MAATRRSRVIWSLVDQVVSSSSNYLLLLLLIRESSLSEVGVYGLAYTSYFLFQSLARGAATEPLVIRHDPLGATWTRERSRGVGVALVCSTGMLVVTVAAALACSPQIRTAFVTLAVCLPGLILQDSVRAVYFAQSRMRAACVNDTLLLGVQAAIYLALWAGDALDPALLLAGWGVAALVAGLVGLVHLRLRPRWEGTRSWFREHRDLIPGFTADYLANRGLEQVTTVLILAVSPVVAGTVTASRTLFAPATTVQTGINSFMLPESAARFRAGDLRRMRAQLYLFATTMVLLMIVLGALIVVTPDRLGDALLGANWPALQDAGPAMALFSALNAFGFALWVGTKAARLARQTLWIRLCSGIVGCVAAVAGAHLDGVTGAVLGMALGAAVLAVGMALLLSRAGRSRPRHVARSARERVAPQDARM